MLFAFRRHVRRRGCVAVADPAVISPARVTARLAAGQIAALLLALIVRAVIHRPVGEALADMRTDKFYAARVFAPAKLFNFVSLFTPKHAFEQYDAIIPRADHLRGHIVFHQGIVVSLLTLQASRRWAPPQRIFVAVSGTFLVLILRRRFDRLFRRLFGPARSEPSRVAP